MIKGQYFDRDGSKWIVRELIPEQNKTFKWLKVIGTWSGIGPMPNWAKEPRTFLIGRERIIPVEGLQTYF